MDRNTYNCIYLLTTGSLLSPQLPLDLLDGVAQFGGAFEGHLGRRVHHFLCELLFEVAFLVVRQILDYRRGAGVLRSLCESPRPPSPGLRLVQFFSTVH